MEWSGIILYTTEGNYGKKGFKCIVHDIFPMDKGTGAYTEYEFNEDFIKYRIENPETLEYHVGHIHSHNSMGAFFSGTDISELKDNVSNHNFYLSIIVNNNLDIVAKIASKGTITKKVNSNFEITGEDGVTFKSKQAKNTTEDAMFVYDMDIDNYTPEFNVTEKFIERTQEVINIAISKPKNVKIINPNQKTFLHEWDTEHFSSYPSEYPSVEIDIPDSSDIISDCLYDALTDKGSTMILEEVVEAAYKDAKEDLDSYLDFFLTVLINFLNVESSSALSLDNPDVQQEIIEILLSAEMEENEYKQFINNIIEKIKEYGSK